MKVRLPIFVGGKMYFDRWIHFNMALAANDLEVGIHGITVAMQPVTFPAATADNGDDLLIGTSLTNSTNVAAPISLYGFKIFQYRMPAEDRMSIFANEATNFNELQYTVYADSLDYDGDKQLDFWQEDITDYGLWTKWPSTGRDPVTGALPVEQAYGLIVPSVVDPIAIPTDLDRDRQLIADWYNASYLQELIDIQTIGFADGLIFWDFMNPGQAATFDYNDRVWDPICQQYRPRTLSYLDWLRNVMAQEWNSVTAVHDPIPGFAEAGSPSPWVAGSPKPEGPWPTFGDKDTELVMTGVKGWFGWTGLLGYRDSLALVAKESIIFDYLQVELHFRAPRTELDALLKPYAHDIDQIFDDAYVGNQLTKQINPA